MTETFIHNFILELAKINNGSYVVYKFNKNGEAINTTISNLSITQIKELGYVVRLKDRIQGQWDTQQNRFKRLNIQFKSSRDNKICIIDYASNFVSLFKSCTNFKVPTFIFIHGYDASKALSSNIFLENLRRLFTEPNIFIVTPCRFFKNKLISSIVCDENRIIVLPYGVNRNLSLDGHEYDVNFFNLLFVGRLVNKKNPIALVEAINVLVNKVGVENFKLTIIGNGPLFNDVLAKIEYYHLQDFIELVGAKKHDDVYSYMAGADIYVQHSVTDFHGDQEGLPNSILEALNMGLPVVSTYHSGIPEIIENNVTGLLVQEFDFEAMARAIASLMSDTILYKKICENIQKSQSEILWSNSDRAKAFLNFVNEQCLIS